MTQEQKAKAYDEALNEFSDIQGYEGLYKINRSGEVLSLRTGKILKTGKNRQGYMNVVLTKNGGTPIPEKQENKWIAWLEKQGQVKESDNSLTRKQRIEEAMRELEEKSKTYMEAHKGESVDKFMAMCRGEQGVRVARYAVSVSQDGAKALSEKRPSAGYY